MFRKSSGILSRGNSGDAGAYGTVPGAEGRRTVRIQIGGTSDNVRRGSDEAVDSFHRVYQTQLPAHPETSYHHISPPNTAPNVTVLPNI